jgi:hypothetical protein
MGSGMLRENDILSYEARYKNEAGCYSTVNDVYFNMWYLICNE